MQLYTITILLYQTASPDHAIIRVAEIENAHSPLIAKTFSRDQHEWLYEKKETCQFSILSYSRITNWSKDIKRDKKGNGVLIHIYAYIVS